MIIYIHICSHMLNRLLLLVRNIFNEYGSLSKYIIKSQPLGGGCPVFNILNFNHIKFYGHIRNQQPLFLVNFLGSPSNVWRKYFYRIWSISEIFKGPFWLGYGVKKYLVPWVTIYGNLDQFSCVHYYYAINNA